MKKYPMLYIQFWAPYDGRRNRLKHVEHFTEINKLCNVTSCWLYMKIHVLCTDPWTSNKFKRVWYILNKYCIQRYRIIIYNNFIVIYVCISSPDASLVSLRAFRISCSWTKHFICAVPLLLLLWYSVKFQLSHSHWGFDISIILCKFKSDSNYLF